MYYNLLWATREHSFDVSLRGLFHAPIDRCCGRSYAMTLTLPVPAKQLVSVDWKESDWVYPQIAGKNNWFGSLQFYDALNGESRSFSIILNYFHLDLTTPWTTPSTFWRFSTNTVSRDLLPLPLQVLPSKLNHIPGIR